MNEAEEKSLVYEVANWLWGTVQGGFNEQQTISQIVVDAVVGMVPVVGDVTAVRDLIAVLLRMSDDPKKREDAVEWMTLVLLLFALIPVAGGAIKGCGKLLLKAGSEAGQHATLLRDMVHLLNRVGEGNAVKFIRELDLEKFLPEVRLQWMYLTQKVDGVLEAVVRRMDSVMSDAMINRLVRWRAALKAVAKRGDEMIPEALKELNRRLKAAQRQIYDGNWHEVPSSLKSSTREAEARLVTTADAHEARGAALARFPQNIEDDFRHVEGWPDLRKAPYLDDSEFPICIAAFSGPMNAVTIPPGTKLYRVLDPEKAQAGRWWLYELPPTGKDWRSQFAVLDSFNVDGEYVEFVVSEPGLRAWAGKASTQVERDRSLATFGQDFDGGGTQLLIDFRLPAHAEAASIVESLPRRPTGWTDHLGLNVPSRETALQNLGQHELEPKKIERAARGAATTQRVLRARPSHRDSLEKPE